MVRGERGRLQVGKQPLDLFLRPQLDEAVDRQIGTDEAKAKRTELWQYLKANTSTGVYNAVKFNLGGLTNMKFPGSDKVILGAYRTARKIFKFN